LLPQKTSSGLRRRVVMTPWGLTLLVTFPVLAVLSILERRTALLSGLLATVLMLLSALISLRLIGMALVLLPRLLLRGSSLLLAGLATLGLLGRLVLLAIIAHR
jgi:hypothetical protein